MSPATQQLQALATSLERLSRGEQGVAEFAASAQALPELRAALPERFGVVLDELLNRLESSALFSEESCSFSQTDLHDSLRLWLAKAGERLQA